jgi:hypothetical protein
MVQKPLIHNHIWPIRVLRMPNMNLGLNSFKVCELWLEIKTHHIFLLAMFCFGFSLLHLTMILRT